MARQGAVSASDITEMKNMIGSLANSVKALSERQSAPGAQIKECQKLIEQVDVDGTASLDYGEFQKLVEKKSQ